MKLLRQIAIQFGVTFVALALLFTLGAPALQRFEGHPAIQKAIYTLGFAGEAYAITPDYEVDGNADDVQVQQALNALPVTGGKLVLYAGNWHFNATVSRAINNVTIEGDGKGTYLVNNAATALFSAGAQTGWVFKDFRTDAGYLTLANDSRVDNVQKGTSYLVSPTGAATYIVASANATASEKAAANWICDGTADQTEINAAIDALGTIGGTVSLTSGSFYISASIDLNDGRDYVWLKGQGVATQLTTSSNIDTIDATPAAQTNYMKITDLSIVNAGGMKGAGAAIQAEHLWNFLFDNLYIGNQYDGLILTHCQNGELGSINLSNFDAYGIKIIGCNVLNMHNVVGDNSVDATVGLAISGNTSGVQAFDVDFVNSGYGVQVVPAAGDTVEWLFFDAVMGDYGDGWGMYIGGAGGTVRGLTATDCWAGSNVAGGVYLGTGTNGVRFIGLKAIQNGGPGFQFAAGVDNALQDSDVIGNATAGANAGVLVSAAVSRFQITGNRIGNDIWGTTTGNQNYGITVAVGASDYYIITDNVYYLSGTTGPISDGGTGVNKEVAHNR